MPQRRAGAARRLGDFVRDLSERADIRYGKRRVAAADAISEAISQLLGAQIASRCRPGPIMGTEAVVQCEGAAVAQRVSMATAEILKLTRDRIGTDDVQSIRVSVAPARRRFDEAP